MKRKAKKVYWAVVPQNRWDNRMNAVMTVYGTRKEAETADCMDLSVEGPTGKSIPAYRFFPVHITPTKPLKRKP